jgi:hypothetical protein
LIQDNLDKLGIGPGFGLMLQGWTLDPQGRQIVRVQLTRGRGDGAERLDNHGILVFRPDGSLMDYQGPLAPGFSPALALQRINQAEQLGLNQHGVPLALVERADGQLQIEARLLQGKGIDSFLQVFSLDHPNGVQRAIGSSNAEDLKAFLPKGAVILTADGLQAAENTSLDAVFAAAVSPAESVPVYRFAGGSSVHADSSPSKSSGNMLSTASAFLTHRSGADAADSDASKVARLGSEPGGDGDGVLPSGVIEFGGDPKVAITD